MAVSESAAKLQTVRVFIARRRSDSAATTMAKVGFYKHRDALVAAWKQVLDEKNKDVDW